jgi:hypothetical protein
LLAGPLAAQNTERRPVDVAVAAMDIGSSTDASLDRLAQRCVTRLVEPCELGTSPSAAPGVPARAPPG